MSKSSVGRTLIIGFAILCAVTIAITIQLASVEAENKSLKRKLEGHKSVALSMDEMGVLKWCETYKHIIAEAKNE